MHRGSKWSKTVRRMYEMNRKNKKQRNEGLEDYAEVASIHGINYIFERNVVAFSRYENVLHFEFWYSNQIKSGN